MVHALLHEGAHVEIQHIKDVEVAAHVSIHSPESREDDNSPVGILKVLKKCIVQRV